MILSYNRLKQLGIDLDIETLSKKMFQLGHEVEEVENTNIDKLVIGQVVEVTKHPDADKLNITKVNVGNDTLQIVCGAKNVAQGQFVIVAVEGAKIGELTIKPIKLKGVESNGMICSLEELGYTRDKLNEEDYSGIHEIKEDVKVGDNPMEVLGLSDKLLDIFLTSNRGDCQSYKGIYNDLSSLLNYDNKNDNLNKILLNDVKSNFETKIENNYSLKVDANYTNGFSHYYIKNVEVAKSDWNRKLYLLKQGIKSQNSLTDISNQVLIETGIPSHIYDADKIKGGLNLLILDKEEKFVGLDEKELMIPKGTLVIKDEEKIVSLAGVMGSNETKVTEDTKNILVEVASFNPKSIFNSSKIIGKKTEAAIRYEKDIDNTIIKSVANLIINDIVSINPNSEVSNEVIKGYKEKENETIDLQYKTVNKILGIDISKEEIINILQKLDFEIQTNENGLKAKAPSYRKDQEIENDLIEEIIRIYNIDNVEIDEHVLSFTPIENIISENKNDFIKKIENILLKQNLNQTISYSLVNEKWQNQFGSEVQDSVILMSPLSKEHMYYRKTLVPSLINIAKENYAYQEKSVNVFEIAQTYNLIDKEIQEDTKLSILLSGDYQNYYLGSKRKYDFYDIKGILEQTLSQLNLSFNLEKMKNSIEQLNPYACANIIVEGVNIGFIGEVVFDYYKKMTNKIYVLEISLNKLKDIVNKKENIKYKKISFLPEVQRDLTMEVKAQVKYEEILEILKDIKYLDNVELVDIYEGEHITKGNKSITIRMNFKSQDSTLQNEEIDKQVEIIFGLCDQRGYIVNGR